MEAEQPYSNQNLSRAETQPQKVGSNNSKLLMIVVISVLVTAMATGSVVYSWQKSANEKAINDLRQEITTLRNQVSQVDSTETTPLPTSQPKSQPSAGEPTADPTANWKIYKDEKNGVEFRYPASWYARSLPGWTFQVFLENRPFEIIEGTEFMTSIGLHFNEYMNTTTEEKHFFEKTLDEGVNRIKALYSEESVKTDDLIIGGKKAVQISGMIGPGMLEGRYFTDTLIQMDGHLLNVELTNRDFKDVYEQILTTFKFTNE